MSDGIASNEATMAASAARKALAPYGHLTGRERRRFVVQQRDAGRTLKALGEMLGIHGSRVRCLEMKERRLVIQRQRDGHDA